MCDLVFMLHIERIERRVLGERQAVAQVALALGVDLDLPSVQDAWDEFEEALADDSDAADVDPDRLDLLRALGLRP